jgi:hypothetical protein
MRQRLAMLKYFLCILGTVCCFIACDGEQNPPADLLPKEKMADILADIHVAEARITSMQLRSLDSSVLVFERMQQQIWKKHKVDTTLYRKSYTFYTSNPAYLSDIYDKVEKKLEEREKKKSIKL